MILDKERKRQEFLNAMHAETDKNEILAMYKDGITCGVIAKTFNVTYSAIYSFLKKNKDKS